MRKSFMFLIIALIFSFLITGALIGLAQYPIPIPQPAPAPEATTQPAQDESKDSKQEEFKGFSGKFEVFKHKDGQYKIDIPVEFKLDNEGLTTDWTGPHIDSMACSIYVNYVDMPDVPSETLYKINLDSYKKKTKEYTDIVPVKVKWAGKAAFAFRVKEVNHKLGKSDKEKDPSDIHRWHLFVFGNGKSYTLGFCANYAAFKGNKVQEMFEKAIKSVELTS